VITESVSLVQVPSNLGRGSRPYFVCPGEVGGCGRRANKLYLARRYFLCRRCCGLLYASQSEPSPWQRTMRRANTLRQRLDRVAAGMGTPLPGKSRPVWAPVYMRLLEEVSQAEMHAYEAGTGRLQWIVNRLDARSLRRKQSSQQSSQQEPSPSPRRQQRSKRAL
jgi:hypothetical protein